MLFALKIPYKTKKKSRNKAIICVLNALFSL